MNISFDYDGTLIHIHHLVEKFQLSGDSVFIVTSRNQNKEHKELYDDADRLGIKRENIHFTNNEIKLPTIEKLNIQLHFDDDYVEVDEINRYATNCIALLVNYKQYYTNE